MMPRLGEKYDIEIETISKPRAEYATAEYLGQGLPKAPAIIMGDEILIEGSDITEDKLEAIIRKHLGLPPPERQKKGFFGRILKK
jgi:hypothetical protein